jgi:hypothetical protein
MTKLSIRKIKVRSRYRKSLGDIPDDLTLRFEQAEEILLQEGKKSRSLKYMLIWAVLFEALKDSAHALDCRRGT